MDFSLKQAMDGHKRRVEIRPASIIREDVQIEESASSSLLAVSSVTFWAEDAYVSSPSVQACELEYDHPG